MPIPISPPSLNKQNRSSAMRTSAPTVFLNLSTGWAHYLHNTLRYFVNAAALTLTMTARN